MEEYDSGYAVIAKVINNKLSPLDPLVKTMIFDNWKEFAGHKTIDAALKSITHFADPFASWKQGSNENFNGFLRLRQYIPKKRVLSIVTDNELRMIQDQLNNRPKKMVGI
jgi:IS30 family transposase